MMEEALRTLSYAEVVSRQKAFVDFLSLLQWLRKGGHHPFGRGNETVTFAPDKRGGLHHFTLHVFISHNKYIKFQSTFNQLYYIVFKK